MALRTPPSWLQNGTHPAENDRLTVTNSLWSVGGVADYGSMRISQLATPGMSVQAAAGHAVIPGTEISNQGFYIAYNDAATTIAIATADPSLPRKDRVVVKVQDSYYSGSVNQVTFAVVTGTPASSPVAPSAPANALSLAIVDVAAGATSLVDANITDVRIQAKFKETIIKSQATATNTLLLEQLTSQTGKAIRIDNSSGTQRFAIAFDGTLTFADGSTQSTAATGGVTSITGGTGITVTGTSAVSVAIDTAVTADLNTAQTLTNKTLTSPYINLGINPQSNTTYTTVLTDNGKLVTLNNGSAIAVTIPLNSSVNYPVGAQINMVQLGAGQVTVSGAGGVTVVSTGATAATPKTRAQYSTLTAIQTSADNWLVVGDIS
jgi:hypothetical protein